MARCSEDRVSWEKAQNKIESHWLKNCPSHVWYTPACDTGRGEVWPSTSVSFVRCHLGTRVALGKPQLQVAFTSKPVRVLIASLSYLSPLPSHFSLAYMYIRAYKLPHLGG